MTGSAAAAPGCPAHTRRGLWGGRVCGGVTGSAAAAPGCLAHLKSGLWGRVSGGMTEAAIIAAAAVVGRVRMIFGARQEGGIVSRPGMWAGTGSMRGGVRGGEGEGKWGRVHLRGECVGGASRKRRVGREAGGGQRDEQGEG